MEVLCSIVIPLNEIVHHKAELAQISSALETGQLLLDRIML